MKASFRLLPDQRGALVFGLWKAKGEISNFLLTSVNNSTQSKPLLANISFRFRCQDNHVPRWTGRNFFFATEKAKTTASTGPEICARWKTNCKVEGSMDQIDAKQGRKVLRAMRSGSGPTPLRPFPVDSTHTHTRVHTPTHSCGQ